MKKSRTSAGMPTWEAISSRLTSWASRSSEPITRNSCSGNAPSCSYSPRQRRTIRSGTSRGRSRNQVRLRCRVDGRPKICRLGIDVDRCSQYIPARERRAVTHVRLVPNWSGGGGQCERPTLLDHQLVQLDLDPVSRGGRPLRLALLLHL